jgi:hypothetical protein
MHKKASTLKQAQQKQKPNIIFSWVSHFPGKDRPQKPAKHLKMPSSGLLQKHQRLKERTSNVSRGLRSSNILLC